MAIFHGPRFVYQGPGYLTKTKTKKNHLLQDGPPKIAKLPYFSGFMVDITIVFTGVISWFINQLISGGPYPEWLIVGK